jgi:hypothetical protein
VNGVSFAAGTLPTVATSFLPPSYTVTLVSGVLTIRNSQVTNTNSWQLTVGQISAQYASGGVAMSAWVGNQTWQHSTPSAGVFVNTAGVLQAPDSSFGNFCGPDSFFGNGDGVPRVMIRVGITPFFFN